MVNIANKDYEYLAIYSDVSAINGNRLKMNFKLV